jgi:hypothetical protein
MAPSDVKVYEGQLPQRRVSNVRNVPLARLLTRNIEDDRYPLSPRIRIEKGILAKLDLSPVVTTKPFPATRPTDRPRAAVLAKKRRRNG